MSIRELDLHGFRYAEASRLVESFVYGHARHLPVNIVCGNSRGMIKAVEDTLLAMNCEWIMLRYGVITVQRYI